MVGPGSSRQPDAPWTTAACACNPWGVSLLWRVALVNATVLGLAFAALVLSPATVSAQASAAEVAVLAAGAIALLMVNVLALRRVFSPLSELTALMGRVDPLNPGRRIEVQRSVAEVGAVQAAFNQMLDRLEHERRTSGRRALDAQERERRRLARELHDELGQTLTGIMLLLDGVAREAPPDLLPSVEQLQESSRGAVEKTRDLARGLRPAALDEFGLRSALTTLAEGFAERTGLRVRRTLADDLPELEPEQDLAIYRTAQESLTNVVRHAEATAVALSLSAVNGDVVLSVADDGRGVTEEALHDMGGVGGMRERAMLIGGRLEINRGPLGGTEVRLQVPVR
jgi:two-component system sensor histidine kinase UhpB